MHQYTRRATFEPDVTYNNETVLFYALLDIFFFLCRIKFIGNETGKFTLKQLDYSPSFSTLRLVDYLLLENSGSWSHC